MSENRTRRNVRTVSSALDRTTMAMKMPKPDPKRFTIGKAKFES